MKSKSPSSVHKDIDGQAKINRTKLVEIHQVFRNTKCKCAWYRFDESGQTTLV